MPSTAVPTHTSSRHYPDNPKHAEANCSIYRDIYQNKEIYQTLQMGGAHRANRYSYEDAENIQDTFLNDHDTVSEESDASALHAQRSHARQLRQESEPECSEDTGAKRALPSVSQKWADLPCKASADMSIEDLQLLATVRAENIFSDGLKEKGGQDPLNYHFDPLKALKALNWFPHHLASPTLSPSRPCCTPQAQRTPLRSA